MEASLVLEALHRALRERQVEADHLLIRTDQGSQYRATAYRELPELNEIIRSMSAKVCCWDNAVVESLFSILKHELGLDDDSDVLLTPQQLHRDLSFWIEGYYNRERPLSTLGYLIPIDYHCQFIRP